MLPSVRLWLQGRLPEVGGIIIMFQPKKSWAARYDRFEKWTHPTFTQSWKREREIPVALEEVMYLLHRPFKIMLYRIENRQTKLTGKQSFIDEVRGIEVVITSLYVYPEYGMTSR